MRKSLCLCAMLLLQFFAPGRLLGQELPSTQTDNSCLAALRDLGRMSLADMRAKVQSLKQTTDHPAASYFSAAEMMKRLGDYDASDYYEKAIDADGSEPCYESFYGDYLRNYRGAGTPLFPTAEEHYFDGWRKSQLRRGESYQKANQQSEDYIERGLSALYQQDGIALLYRTDRDLKRPYAFLSTIDRYAESTADLDRNADVRDYTSEALFSESVMRLNRPLTFDELRGLIRTKKAAETVDRIRFRYKAMPVIDVFYTHRHTVDDQVTSFFKPGGFNDLRLNEFGFRVQKPFTLGHQVDASLSGTFDVDQRWGLIEFLPDSEERILDWQAQASVSHFFGPDKATAQFTFAHQSIHPEVVPAQSDRYRQFVGANITYNILRPVPFLQLASDKRFETRGWDVFGGFLRDTESFPPATVNRNDYFVGTSLKGVGRFDFTLQPTWFTSDVDNDPSQHNIQYRTNVITLFRIVDEEANDGIPTTRSGLHLAFLHLVVSFRQDAAIAGPKSFENSKIGAELDSKFFTYSRWTTFLISARYDHQQFNELRKANNAFGVNLSLGF